MVISLKPTRFPGGWIQSQLWYLGMLLTQRGVLSHWVLDMKEMDLCWEVSIYSARYKALWELPSGVHCDPDPTLHFSLLFSPIWNSGFWVSNFCMQSRLSPSPQGAVHWRHAPLCESLCHQEFISGSALATQALILKVNLLEMETLQDLKVKTSPSFDL